MQSQQRILSVESVRGWACFMVLISHLSLAFFPYLHAFEGVADPNLFPLQAFIHDSPFGFFFSGSAAVAIFFVLSGFILTIVALKQQHAKSGFLAMFVKRYPRLMLPALASCIFAFLVYHFTDLKNPELSYWMNYFGHSREFTLLGSVYNSTIEVFFITGESLYNPVLWTIQIELLGSFIIYFLCLNRITLKIPFLAMTFFVLTAYLTATELIVKDHGLGIIAFLAGYLFALHGRVISGWLAFSLMTIGFYFAGVHNTSKSYAWLINYLGDDTYSIGNLIAGILIVYAILFCDKLSNHLGTRLSLFLGKMSYSVYLLQMPILTTFGIFIFNFLYIYTGVYDVAAILASIFIIILIYVVSVPFYYCIDAQGIKYSNKIANYVCSTSISLNRKVDLLGSRRWK